MAFKLTNSPLKNIDSTENRDNARAMEEAKAAKAGIEGQEDITQSANQIAKSSQLDNIENKLTELSDNFSQSQEPEKKSGENWANPRNMMSGGLGGMFGGAFFKKKKY
tara:strand:- start:321 stop:644 length:324 start_codon:yes stop_codon:yes gene_type:complete